MVVTQSCGHYLQDSSLNHPRPSGPLHVAMQMRLYYHPGGVFRASPPLGRYSFRIVVEPSLAGLAADYLGETSQQFTEFSVTPCDVTGLQIKPLG